MNKISEVFKSLLKNKSLRYGSYSILLIIAVIAIAVVVNMVVGLGTYKLDLTPDKIYTIGDETKTILKDVNKDVTIYGLFDDQKNAKDSDIESQLSPELMKMVELLKQYDNYNHISVKYVDTDKNPGFINSIDPEKVQNFQKGDFAVVCGKKIKKLTAYGLIQFDPNTYQVIGLNAEQGFTGAIKFVTADKTPVLTFTQGHGEATLEANYSAIKEYLERNNYIVNTVNLATKDKVPEDTDVLIVASPTKDLASAEKDRIKDYISGGGKAVFMFDSVQTNATFTQFDDLLSNYNVSLNYDRVRENDSGRYLPGKNYDFVPSIQPSLVTENIDDVSKLITIFHNARSINILKNAKETVSVTSLMKTSSSAVGEQVDTTKENISGKALDVGAAIEYKGGAQNTRLLVLGNSYFISDKSAQENLQYTEAGATFLLNALNWVQERPADVIIQAKTDTTDLLQVSEKQSVFAQLFTLIILPLIILGLGTFVWMRRRHL